MNNNRNNNNNNRRRGRGNRPQGQGGGGPVNRIDSRARGNAPQMLEKFRKLAQDAQHNGDRVQAEYYLQFADHYYRVMADTRLRQEEARPRRNDEQPGQRQAPADEFDGEDEDAEYREDMHGDRQPPRARQEQQPRGNDQRAQAREQNRDRAPVRDRNFDRDRERDRELDRSMPNGDFNAAADTDGEQTGRSDSLNGSAPIMAGDGPMASEFPRRGRPRGDAPRPVQANPRRNDPRRDEPARNGAGDTEDVGLEIDASVLPPAFKTGGGTEDDAEPAVRAAPRRRRVKPPVQDDDTSITAVG